MHLVSALLIVGILGFSGFLLSASALTIPTTVTPIPSEPAGLFGTVTLSGAGSYPAAGMLSTYLTPNTSVNASAGAETSVGENESESVDNGLAGNRTVGNSTGSELNRDLDAADTIGEEYGADSASADERMRSLIADTSMPLLMFTVQSLCAERCNDTIAIQAAASEMYERAAYARGEAASLEVSEGMQPVQANFLRALEKYEEAGFLLKEDPSSNATTVSSALSSITEGCSFLEVAMQGPGQEALLMQAETGLSAPALEMHPALQEENESEDYLALLERFCYDDPEGENMLSFIVESTGKVRSFTYTSDDEREIFSAGNDRQFLLVIVKATNLGHKGDSDLYLADSPETAAATLRCHGREYQPMDLPAETSLGESYAATRLERYASKEGFLVFDVPASLNVSETSLHVDLGQNGVPAWNLAEPPR
jgi:hypothetical protein